MSKVFTLAKKELWSYFATPTALIFLSTYLFITLFNFFWVEKFFTRNIADLRPLFEMMPLVMIFLVSTITMKMWSEEKRTGTLEFLMTLPVKTHELVLGKFLACMALVSLALSLTFFLPISVNIMSGGSLDWGPVVGAYFASLLLGSAYTSIGLYVSSKTESQIISLILTAFLCFGFYLIGSSAIVNFLGSAQGELLKLFGSGSRFAAISRGVLDFRDIYYYLSITAVFLALNVFSLEKSGWSFSEHVKTHKTKTVTTGLLVLNVLFANFWLHSVGKFRWDMTEQKVYSISQATTNILEQIEEPLLLRGYFSERTHPLLAPLVPIVTDLMKEYKLVNPDGIQLEVVDPKENPEIEADAARTYNIEPVSFQVADRHSASVLNSYFNILVQYGTKFEVLSFQEMIDVKSDGMKAPEVRFRNLEHDITAAIKKAIYSFNNTDNLFASLKNPIDFVAYVSEDILPEKLSSLTTEIKASLKEYQKTANSKLNVSFQDPSKNPELAEEISNKFGFSPQTTSVFSTETFYFYLTLQDGNKVIPLGIPDNFEVTSFNNDMNAALKRLAPGFLRTVGIYTPPSAPVNPMLAQYGMQQPQGKQFKAITQKLGENYRVESVDLGKGVVSSEIDTLLVLAPKELHEKQIFAIDQFLMKGGSVILVTSPVSVTKQRDGVSSEKYSSSLEPWLSHYGVSISESLVLDKNNSKFPDQKKRVVQGYTVKEPYLAPYPLFPDVRSEGLNKDNAITSSVRQITFAWGSPIELDTKVNESRKVTHLIKSSEDSWVSQGISIEKNRTLYPEYGFEVPDETSSSLLAVMIEGEFSSFYKGKKSPLLQKKEVKKEEHADHEGHENNGDHGPKSENIAKDDGIGVVTSVIERSPKTSSLIVYASNEFVADDTIQIESMLAGSPYLNTIQLLESSVDWNLEDRALLSLRNRRHFARTLKPLSDEERRNWELANYFLALLGLFAVYGASRLVRKSSAEHYKKLNLV